MLCPYPLPDGYKKRRGSLTLVYPTFGPWLPTYKDKQKVCPRPDDIQKEDAAEPNAARTSPAGLSSRVDVPIALSSYRLQIAKFERRR